MEHNQDKETFHFTYSAKEQEEIRSIRKKYAAPEENKMERLRRLDAGVTQKGTTAALVVGILGTLLLGLGMSLAMSDLSELLGAHRDMAMVIGVLIGVVGLCVLAAAYPVYTRVTKKEREKIAPEIIRLTDELMK